MNELVFRYFRTTCWTICFREQVQKKTAKIRTYAKFSLPYLPSKPIWTLDKDFYLHTYPRNMDVFQNKFGPEHALISYYTTTLNHTYFNLY